MRASSLFRTASAFHRPSLASPAFPNGWPTAASTRMLSGTSCSTQAATLPRQPAPTVIHFARFEQPFLRMLAGGPPPLDIVCTHDIARRLLPDLPRCSVRALAGYFGRGIGPLRRSADHVDATAFVWQALAGLLQDQGISTWSALHEWLATKRDTSRRARRVWPMPREVRLSLPDAPGINRMLRTSGDVLYVGKAASLHHRVNSHFRKQNGLPERTLEMLSQARGISNDVTPSALEAALCEADEIKRRYVRSRLREALRGCTPSWRARTSARTRDCCGWAHVCGKKVDGARAAPSNLADPAGRCQRGVDRARHPRHKCCATYRRGKGRGRCPRQRRVQRCSACSTWLRPSRRQPCRWA